MSVFFFESMKMFDIDKYLSLCAWSLSDNVVICL